MSTYAADDVAAINARVRDLARHAGYRSIDPNGLVGDDLDALGEFLGVPREVSDTDYSYRLRVVVALQAWRGGA